MIVQYDYQHLYFHDQKQYIVTNKTEYKFEIFSFKQPYHEHQWTKSKFQKYIHKSCSVQHTTHYRGSLKKN